MNIEEQKKREERYKKISEINNWNKLERTGVPNTINKVPAKSKDTRELHKKAIKNSKKNKTSNIKINKKNTTVTQIKKKIFVGAVISIIPIAGVSCIMQKGNDAILQNVDEYIESGYYSHIDADGEISIFDTGENMPIGDTKVFLNYVANNIVDNGYTYDEAAIALESKYGINADLIENSSLINRLKIKFSKGLEVVENKAKTRGGK